MNTPPTDASARMAVPSISDSEVALHRLVDQVLAESGFRQNPYFRALEDGRFSLEDFIETQMQFHSAVVFFSRPMAALAAKIPDPLLRCEILRNVWEEHGEGNPGKMHGRTFVAFLARIQGCGEAEAQERLDQRPLWPEVRAFNTVLAGSCVLDEYLVGAGVMGIIERMFSEISLWIGRSCVSRGFLAADNMVHYDLHEKIDVRHADDFFQVLAASWSQGERQRYDIEQGLRTGAFVFDRLYSSLYDARGLRRLR